ncbi:long-chain fatty acid--CoA ligase [Mycobacterium sp. IDR2000157661]|uniref:long-chain fatty acid--CoA ligase n=1 Tax=Mycobacterium sp. IDR2000157661 TaxID=2867005 RepID=UPI001EEB6970|nr:long-chain fatty acid--CoA ligase [Mycobacterium sp. IDR2000157661]ULE32156.1 long-chain fatty acid--CoA ligase [Mycobacterium sp. IDR2000157661]
MRSTMQDVPLTVRTIVKHATSIHADRRVITPTESGYRGCDYAALGRRVGQLANGLRAVGITGDQRVATFLWNNQEHLEAYCAVPSMGAVLHTLNIRLSPEQLGYIANHAHDEVVIVDMSLAPLLARALPGMHSVHTVIAVGDGDTDPLRRTGKTVLSYNELIDAQLPEFDWPELDERSASAMCYTSGTTGNPKGVVYSHRSAYLHSLTGCIPNALGIGEADRVLPIVPMFHANAWGLVHSALIAGAELVLPDKFMQAPALVTLIEDTQPTIAGAVPTLWNDIVHYMESDPGHDISSLRLIACGGSAVPVSLIRRFETEFGIPMVQAWGMTETSPLATVARPASAADERDVWIQRASQGRPICGIELRLRDDDGHTLPWDGVAVGEIQARGPWVTGAYCGDDDDEKFDDRWLRTGDVGRIDEHGFLTLTDRAKDVIKSGGEWISSVDLENSLIAHPQVLEAAVIGVPDEKWQERPLAFIVAAPTAAPGCDELRAFLDGKVPKWWIPERWSFVSEIPRTSVGKYDKKLLRIRHRAGDHNVSGGD